MLTGDHRAVGDAIGKEVGVDEVRAELLPEDKVAAIQEFVRQHGSVAMVGDGVNDAPALAQAIVGIAMGAAGTATALETANVALMADDLSRLPFAISLSRQARAIIRQNLHLSLGIVALLILAATTGLFGIGPAVLVHEGSTLVVSANALDCCATKAEGGALVGPPASLTHAAIEFRGRSPTHLNPSRELGRLQRARESTPLRIE